MFPTPARDFGRSTLDRVTERRQEFEHDLESIEGKVIELFAMVAEDLPTATQALLNCDGEALTALIERDRAIDALYREVEELVNREILLQAPVASDLRFLLSVLRIVPELERSHDLVVHIAARANRIFSGDLSARARGLIEAMVISRPPCGGRRPTPGTSATGQRRRPWSGATRRWTICTPA